MARVIPVAEISQMEAGQEVLAIRGTIVKVDKRSDGANEHGPWSLQRATLQDPDGKTIKIKFQNLSDQAHWLGKEVLLQCIKNDTGKFTGVRIKDDTYKGVTTRMLWVTPSADIGLAAVDADGNRRPAQQQQRVHIVKGWTPQCLLQVVCLLVEKQMQQSLVSQ